MKYIGWPLIKQKEKFLLMLFPIKINENLKKNNEWDKNGKLLSLSKTPVYNIFGKK